jgi:formate hydrogenlyase subunit 3/multisubunit Na+/H+ antiporter MnhD subunit
MSGLLALAWVFPLAAAALAPAARLWWLPAVAALPALAAAAAVPVGERLEIPWLLLGSVLGLDETGRVFLAFTAVLWLAAGVYASGSLRTGPRAGHFRAFFLLAMAGNLWLIVGQDLVSFYAGFSLMGLASYGLVIHDLDKAALRAGKVYLIMTLIGELALFVALVLIAGQTNGLVPQPAELVGLNDLAIGLLLFGLAIKAGLVPLHVWLPLAHPAAPVPASAVLSGAMIKVALLGWLRFLPIGEAALTEWGVLLVMIGLATLFFAIPVGLVQSNLKVILAYSSVSKMGLMAMTLGLILLEPALAPVGIPAIALYAAHHALAKGGLFLGVGLRRYWVAQGLVLTGTFLLALSLAGAPLTGGAVAKYGVKPIWLGTDWAWLNGAVTLGTTATALLMLRFLWVTWRTAPHPSPGHTLGGLAWAALVVLSLLFSLLLGTPAAWGTNAVPTAVALASVLPFAFVAWRRPDLLRPAVDRVPPGDLIGLVRPPLAILDYVLRAFAGWSGRLVRAGSRGLDKLVGIVGRPPADPESGLRQWPSAGAAWLLITALLLAPFFWTLAGSPFPARPPAAVPTAVPGASEPDAKETPKPPRELPPRSTEMAEDPSGAEGAGPADPVTEPAAAAAMGPATEPGPPEGTAGPRPGPGGKPREVPEKLPPEATPADQGDRVVAPAEPGERVEPADTAVPEEAGREPGSHGDGVCDPRRPFVFDHPEVERPLRLVICEPTPQGARRVAAPPLTNRLVGLVQRHLSDLGYDTGPVDGLIGPRTREAIRRFQRGRGEEPTGVIGFRLLEQIRAAAGAAESSEGAGAAEP